MKFIEVLNRGETDHTTVPILRSVDIGYGIKS